MFRKILFLSLFLFFVGVLGLVATLVTSGLVTAVCLLLVSLLFLPLIAVLGFACASNVFDPAAKRGERLITGIVLFVLLLLFFADGCMAWFVFRGLL